MATTKTNINHDTLRESLMLQIQQLTNPEEGTDIEKEIEKSKMVCNLAQTMIDIDKTETDGIKAKAESLNSQTELLKTMYECGVNFKDSDVKFLLERK